MDRTLACRGAWLLAAFAGLGLLAYPVRTVMLGFAGDSLGGLFLFLFAMTGLSTDDRLPAGVWRNIACGAACLAALAVQPVALLVTGTLAQMLTFTTGRPFAAACGRLLLFAGGCVPGAGGLAAVAALGSGRASGYRQEGLSVSLGVSAGCATLALCRALSGDGTGRWEMAVALLVVALLLGACNAATALTSRRLGPVLAGIGLLPLVLALMAVGLTLLARLAGSPLSALAAAQALILDLLCFWPAALALLQVGDVVTRQAGSDHVGRMGGLALLAPSLATVLAGGLFILTVLPPSGGFGVFWLLAETLLALTPLNFAAALPWLLLLLALSALAVLGFLASLRVTILVLLGGPRSPRMAACADMSLREMMPLLAGLGVPTLLALAPGGLLRLAAPAVSELAGQPDVAGTPQPVLSLVGPDGLSSWTPVGLVAVVGILFLGLRLLRKRASVRDMSAHLRPVFPDVTPGEVSPWADGMAFRSAWLPFGDPLLWPGTDLARAVLTRLLLPSSNLPRLVRRYGRRGIVRCLVLFRALVDMALRVEQHGLAAVLLLAVLALTVTALWP